MYIPISKRTAVKAYRLVTILLASIATACSWQPDVRDSLTIANGEPTTIIDEVEEEKLTSKPTIVLLHGIASPGDYSITRLANKLTEAFGDQISIIIPKREGELSMSLPITEQANMTLTQIMVHLIETGTSLESPIIIYGDSQGGLVAAESVRINYEDGRLTCLNIVGIITNHAPWGGAPILKLIPAVRNVAKIFTNPSEYAGAYDMAPNSPFLNRLNRGDSQLTIPILALGGTFQGETSNFRMIAHVIGGRPLGNQTGLGGFWVKHVEKRLANTIIGSTYNDCLIEINAQYPSYHTPWVTYCAIPGYHHYQRMDEGLAYRLTFNFINERFQLQ